MKYIYPLFLLFLLISCGPEGSSFIVRGEFQDLKEGELYIYNQTNGEERFDTIRVREGEFIYRGNTKKMAQYTLVFPNAVEQAIFIDGGDDLTYEASAKDLRNYKVSGNKENELMNKFREETNKKNASQTRDIALTYINNNATSPVAIYLFDRYFVQDPEVKADELTTMLEQLKTANPQNLFLLNIEGKLTNANKGNIGSVLPDLLLPTKKKDTLDIATIKSDYTLIVCWASWCENAYELASNIRKVRKAYKNEDSLCIISASADTEIFRWQDYTRQDSVGIHNYCEGKAWDSPIIKELNITHLPAYIIADKDRKIIVRKEDNDLKDMLTEITKLF